VIELTLSAIAVGDLLRRDTDLGFLVLRPSHRAYSILSRSERYQLCSALEEE
jgi:hypothetical protein